MNQELLYPKSIKLLLEKMNYIIDNESNVNKVANINNWLEWFKKENYKLNYICKDNEYLRAYYDNNKYGLQVWKHNDEVDSVMFNLFSNYYSEYDTDITIVNYNL